MLNTIWEHTYFRAIVYLVSWLFFGIMGAGSLSYFANVSKATYNDIERFLSTLRFPFRQVVDIYYGRPLEHESNLIIKTTRGSASLTRIFGATPPLLLVSSAIYNLANFQHNPEEILVILICDIGLYALTFLIMWRFGSKLKRKMPKS